MIYMPDENNQIEGPKKTEAKPLPRRSAARVPGAPRKPFVRDRREPAQKRMHVPTKKEKKLPQLKLFGRWPSDVQTTDIGLANYINLEPRFLPRSAGVHRNIFHKSKMHIVERLALHLLIPGHHGKRHRLTSGKLAGNFHNAMRIVENALEIIEKKENKNPLEVLVKALENAAAREEIITYQLGSIMAREAVITAPQRRIDKTLRNIAQGSYRNSFNKKTSIEQTLANEIIAAARGSNESFAVREKERLENEAAGAR